MHSVLGAKEDTIDIAKVSKEEELEKQENEDYSGDEGLFLVLPVASNTKRSEALTPGTPSHNIAHPSRRPSREASMSVLQLRGSCMIDRVQTVSQWQ